MGKQKKNWLKCTERHCPNIGNKYERTEVLNSGKISSGANVSGVTGPEVEKDSHVIASTSKSLHTRSTQGILDGIQRQILR